MAEGLHLFIPELAGMLYGFDWDMSISERTSYQNQFTEHAIEDPQRSFLIDHNREKPVELKINMQVSANPACQEGGSQRVIFFYEKLLEKRAKQSVSTDEFFDVYTGLKVHENMGIKSVIMNRSADYPNLAQFEITLYQFRFAQSPALIQNEYILGASKGRKNNKNKTLVSESDRMICEGTQFRNNPRLARTNKKHKTAIAKSLKAL